MSSSRWPHWRGSTNSNKYNAKKTEVDSITFDSKKEADYYNHLKMMLATKAIRYFLRQVPFDLPGNTKYRCDFMICGHDGAVRYIDVKGRATTEFIRAKKQVEALYPVEIEVV